MKHHDESRDDEVRRLLADARHDEPMPADVVARLDRVLADLGDEPARARPVTDLATRRRRVTRMLLAAAAVVVVGVGVQQVVSPQSADDESSSPTADRQVEPGAAAESADGASGSDSAGGQEGAPEESGALSVAPGDRTALTELTSSDFPDEVTEVRATEEFRATAQKYSFDASLGSAYDATGRACGADTWGRGTFVPVLYDGSPAVLVFRRAMGDTQVADLFVCGDTEPVRSVTLPAK